MNDDVAVLDANTLAELRESVGGDDAFIADLVATYCAEAPEHLAAMSAAAEARDAAAVVRPAHTLKSSSAALGALRLAQMAREIEMSGRNGQSEGLSEQVAAASATWQQTLEEIKRSGLA
jgi:HPt (histidine-containing phosphotransfer) domain-containing protein